MATSTKCIRVITTLFSFILFFPSLTFAAVTAENINTLSQSSNQIFNTFLQQTLHLRLKIQYSQQFAISNDKETLHKLAKDYRDQLQEIAASQQTLKTKIENYTGDDWDDKYGSTGLWRKLASDLYTTTLLTHQLDYYIALATPPSQSPQLLHQLLTDLNSLDATSDSPDLQLLKAKTNAALSRTDPAYKSLAIEQLDSLINHSQIPDTVYFHSVIEKYKLLAQSQPNQLDILAEELARSSCSNDLEIILSLAFLQRQYDPDALETITKLWPQTQNPLSSLLLSDISARLTQQQSLNQTTAFEAQLAALSAWQNNPQNHKNLLDHLANTEKFQTPLILYTTALAFTDSQPAKAVNLLIKASNCKQPNKNNLPDTAPEKLAAKAAQLAYNLFMQNSTNCPLTLQAFDNYSKIAGEKIDQELEYLYTVVLNNCSQSQKAKLLLEKIANRPSSYWPNKAKLNLISQSIQHDLPENQQHQITCQLNDLITSCTEPNQQQIRAQALPLYCQLLLDSNDNDSAQKIVDILTKTKTTRDPNLNLFKAIALRQLNRLNESAYYMLPAFQANTNLPTEHATQLLSEILDKIEQLQTRVADFDKMIQNCHQLANFYDTPNNDCSTSLVLTEISIFALQKDKLQQVEKQLSNLAENCAPQNTDLIRCRARLLQKQNQFEASAKQWANICQIRKTEPPFPNQRSWKWWRAKFYELYCCAQIPDAPKNNIAHTIEVLQNSFPDIPPLWAQKLALLKKQIPQLSR